MWRGRLRSASFWNFFFTWPFTVFRNLLSLRRFIFENLMIECIFNCLCHFEGCLFPVTDGDKDLKTEVFVSGENNRVDFKEVDEDPHKFFYTIMFDEKMGMLIKLQGKPENFESSELFWEWEIEWVKGEFGDGERKIIGDVRVLKGWVVKAKVFIFKDLNSEKDTLARLVLMSSRPARN